MSAISDYQRIVHFLMRQFFFSDLLEKTLISYSSTQKAIGGKFKSYIEDYCGYEVFIAHDDIPGSALWEKEIIKGIEISDFFIPLISKEFADSPFADQETGIAVYLKKKIIPIKLEEINPYGFISKYQAIPFRDDIKEIALAICQIGLSYQPNRQKSLNSIVYAFCTSRSFEIANATIRILCTCRDFSGSHIKQILSATNNNSQIQGAFELSSLKKFLQDVYKIPVD